MLKKIIVMIIISLSCSIGYANNLSESNTVIIVDNTPKVVVKLAPAAVQNSGIAAQYLRKKAPID